MENLIGSVLNLIFDNYVLLFAIFIGLYSFLAARGKRKRTENEPPVPNQRSVEEILDEMKKMSESEGNAPRPFAPDRDGRSSYPASKPWAEKGSQSQHRKPRVQQQMKDAVSAKIGADKGTSLSPETEPDSDAVFSFSNLSENPLVNAVIAAEILGKPRSLR